MHNDNPDQGNLLGREERRMDDLISGRALYEKTAEWEA